MRIDPMLIEYWVGGGGYDDVSLVHYPPTGKWAVVKADDEIDWECQRMSYTWFNTEVEARDYYGKYVLNDI